MKFIQYLTVFVCLFMLTACEMKIGGDKKDEDTNKEKKEKKVEKIPVEISALETGAIESILKSTTHLEAEEEVTILARTSNQVKEILVEEGDTVERDQVILIIEDGSQQVNLAKASSQVKKAKMDFERQENLFKQHLISDQDFNEIKYNLLQNELALEDAERELEYTKVRAAIKGTVTARYINVGDQININQQLFDIIDFDSLVARVYLPETNLGFLELGQKARIQTTALGDKVFKGAVTRISPVVDSKTGTVKVTIGVGNQPGLKPGMYVDVELILQTNPQALLIPKRALTYDADQMFVFKLKDDRTVERFLVQPKLIDKFNIEPLSGFEVGDQVVVAGQSGLKNGSIVRLPGDPEEKEEPKSDETEGKNDER